MSFGTSMRMAVVGLISTTGEAATLARGAGAFTRATSAVAASATASQTVTITKPTEEKKWNGTSTVRTGISIGYVAAAELDWAPEVNDLLTIGAVVWKVVGASEYGANGVIAAYELRLQRVTA